MKAGDTFSHFFFHSRILIFIWNVSISGVFLCICHVPELSIFFLFQLNSFFLSLVHIIPLLTPVVVCAHTKRNSTSLEVLSDSFIEHIWADNAPTCHSRVRGILQNPRDSSASATKSHLRISSPKWEKRGNMKQQCLCFYLPCVKKKYID